jgi:prevent-host-death family protein
MQRLSVGGARDQLADALNRVAYRGERIIIERRGKSLAAVVPMEDLELLQALEDRIDLEEAREALAEAEGVGTVPWEQVKAELGL